MKKLFKLAELISEERERQDENFGKINAELSLAYLFCVVVEEIGEIAKEINEANIGQRAVFKNGTQTEIIQAIACLIQIWERLEKY